jgi:prepilin-type N-terminal cleavage/methylation domain-containing protein/prepilin-type processing-associated H-X9-DG protein
MFNSSRASNHDADLHGFTLVELLTVIAILGLLVQLLLPAVQAARESARRVQCQSNLRQIALGFQQHEGSHQYYPTGGWGWRWTGHPNHGYGEHQPGGWAYNLLEYIEEANIRSLGAGIDDTTPEFKEAILQANSTPISLFYCPSRRPVGAYPLFNVGGMPVEGGEEIVGFSPLLPDRCKDKASSPCFMGRLDYAGNAGSNYERPSKGAGWGVPGPPSLEGAETYAWETAAWNGITYQRSKVRAAQITDGLSHTICAGEKFVYANAYDSGVWNFDDQSMFVGHDFDTLRCTGTVDGEPIVPIRDGVGSTFIRRSAEFGSAHMEGCNYALCDGSVHFFTYNADPEAHRLRGGRSDEQ